MLKRTPRIMALAAFAVITAQSAEAKFLSVDPVTMMEMNNDPRYFNRYAYSFNDPINNIDPDGRKVRNIGDPIQAGIALNYLSQSSTFESQYSTIVGSDLTYNINVSSAVKTNNFVPSPTGGTININPTAGSINGAGEVSSPASALGHEVAHAVQRDGTTLSGHQQNSVSPRISTGTRPITDSSGNQVGEEPTFRYGTSSNERGATNVQNQINSEIGEPQRQNYNDSERVTTCGVTSTDQC